MISRLEAAEGPDEALDRDISRLLQDYQVRPYTSALPVVLARLRRTFSQGGWRVVDGPERDVLIWEHGATEAQSECFSSAWRNDAGGTYMPHPPANLPIAYTLAMLRRKGEPVGA